MGFKINRPKFLNSKISELKISNYRILAVYLPSNDSTQIGKLNMERDMLILRKRYVDLTNLGLKVLLIGDFNSDLKRANKYDHILINCITNLRLINHIEVYEQPVDHIFFKGNKKSTIDHVIAKPDLEEIINAEILVSEDNRGDHHAVLIELELKTEHQPIKISQSKWDEKKFIDQINVSIHSLSLFL